MMAVSGIHRVRDAVARNAFLKATAPATEPVVTVIVPLFDAVDDAAACITSVARHTLRPFRLVLINDGSRDPQVSALLTEISAAASQLLVVDRPDNRGFISTVNEGLALAGTTDAVILNADTLVSERWLDKLVAVARSRSNVATVTPLTNNGTICSVPNVLVENEIPDDYTLDRFAALIEHASLEVFPEAPTGVGFCMLLTRRALEVVGAFDAEAFGAGYGEENDFCQRAIRAGFVNLIADNTFVYHKGRASFGPRTPTLIAKHLETLAAKHPKYAADVAAFYRDHPLRPFHKYLDQLISIRCDAEPIRERVLHILHHGGGTEKHARELAQMADPGVVSYVLVSDSRKLDVDEYHRGRKLRSLRFPLSAQVGHAGPGHDPGYRDALATICWTLQVTVIHVHHLMHNALDIADVAAERNVPYLMTLHDYYMVCPMYTLLAPDGRACGACLGRLPAVAAHTCMTHHGRTTAYLADYQQRTEAFLRGAVKVIAPNVRVSEIIGERFREIGAAIQVIEHGHRRSDWMEQQPVSYDGQGPLQVAIIGGLELHKGSGVFRSLLKANRSDRIVFHLYGTTNDPELRGDIHRVRRIESSAFVYHGPYDAHEIVAMLRKDGVHVGLQLAIWPEAFSFTLSEFVEAGIPVIAGDLGAQGERVRRLKLGWIVPEMRKTDSIVKILDAIVCRPALLSEVARAMCREHALSPIDAMWTRYRDIYRDIKPAEIRTMTDETDRSEACPARGYVAYLAMSLADSSATDPALRRALEISQAEVATLRERLRSPRHRIAETVGNAIQKIPVVWPVLAWVTDAVLERRQRH